MKDLEESVVLITSADPKKKDVIGTGFVIYREAQTSYVLTCAHVVKDVGGENNVLIYRQAARVIASSDVNDFDLAVLAVEHKSLLERPILRLDFSGGEGKGCKVKTAGYYLYSSEKKRSLASIEGVLGRQKFREDPDTGDRAKAWEIHINQGQLQKGYSGSPVVNLSNGKVTGVVTNMGSENSGEVGEIISIEALEIVCPELVQKIRDYVSNQQLALEQEDQIRIYQENLEKYRDEFEKAVAYKYPLEEFVRSTLANQWRSWGLRDKDVKAIEKPILERAEADCQRKLKTEEEDRKRRETEVERKRLEAIRERERREQEDVKRQSKNENPKSFVEDLGNGVKLEMLLIPKGSFMMGSPDSDTDAFSAGKPQHRVEITQEFYMGKFAVTQAQYEAVMGSNPSHFKQGGRFPVEKVSWYDAQAFCQKLSEKSGKKYRLPSEAEWEYSCRAGTETKFHFGNALTKNEANISVNIGTGLLKTFTPGFTRTVEVGNYVANDFGLYDMHGNVWEWCEDSWEDNYGTPRTQKPFVNSSGKKVLRGGSWYDFPRDCRSASRFISAPDNRRTDIGFRVVCVP